MTNPQIKAETPVGVGASKIVEMGNIYTEIVSQLDPRTQREEDGQANVIVRGGDIVELGPYNPGTSGEIPFIF